MINELNIGEFFYENIGTIIILIGLLFVILQIAMIIAILKIYSINNKLNALIMIHDNANDTKIEQLNKIEKYLEIIAETEIKKIENLGTPTS